MVKQVRVKHISGVQGVDATHTMSLKAIVQPVDGDVAAGLDGIVGRIRRLIGSGLDSPWILPP